MLAWGDQLEQLPAVVVVGSPCTNWLGSRLEIFELIGHPFWSKFRIKLNFQKKDREILNIAFVFSSLVHRAANDKT